MIRPELVARASLVALGLICAKAPTLRAQDQGLIPYPGETAAEFEARKRGLPRPPPRPDASGATVTFTANRSGHFLLEPQINGTPIRMLVDTGATFVALNDRDARSVGVAPAPQEFKMRMPTANGIVMAAPVTLREIAVGGISVHDIPAVVIPEDKLGVSLLGMTFLSKLSRFEVSSGRLVLSR